MRRRRIHKKGGREGGEDSYYEVGMFIRRMAGMDQE